MADRAIGEIIDTMYRLREKKKEVDSASRQIGNKIEELKAQLIQICDDQKSEGARGRVATANLSRSVVPVAKDWHLANQFILRHKELSLLQKRLSPPRYREILEERPKGIPGIESFENVTVNLTALKR